MLANQKLPEKTISIRVQEDALDKFKECVLALLEDPSRKMIPNEFFSQALRIYVSVQEEKVDNQYYNIAKNLDIDLEHFMQLSFAKKLEVVRTYYKSVTP